jgi:hypothetical protein
MILFIRQPSRASRDIVRVDSIRLRPEGMLSSADGRSEDRNFVPKDEHLRVAAMALSLRIPAAMRRAPQCSAASPAASRGITRFRRSSGRFVISRSAVTRLRRVTRKEKSIDDCGFDPARRLQVRRRPSFKHLPNH